MEDLLSSDRGLKAYVNLKISMKKKKIGEDGEEYFIYSEPYFRCKDFTITNSNVITDALDRAAEEIKNIIAGWLSEGSGCVIDEILQHYVKIVKYVPLRGNSYIQLPKELRNSMKGLINLKNEYDKCAIWCLVRHLNPRKIHPERITGSDREFIKGLDLKYITYPVTINQIPQIERQNNININVFGYDKNSIFPIYVSGSGANHRSKYQKNPDHMELLYIEEKEGEGEKQHHVYIKDFNRLMCNFTKHKERKHFCMHCLQCFYSNDGLAKHKKDCIVINGVQAIGLPKTYIDKNGAERAPSVYFKKSSKTVTSSFCNLCRF